MREEERERVYVCVREEAREKERPVCACVCVCVCEDERVCVCVQERGWDELCWACGVQKMHHKSPIYYTWRNQGDMYA